MGTFYGTSTLDTASGTYVSILEFSVPDLGYTVILLMCILGVLTLDLFRRLFSKR